MFTASLLQVTSSTVPADVALWLGVVVTGAFLVISISVMRAYQRVTGEIVSSVDLGRSLSSALENRLKKQDERILDVMARMEVLQARSAQVEIRSMEAPPPRKEAAPQDVTQSGAFSEPIEPRQERGLPVESTGLAILRLLVERPHTSVEIKSLINKSREHTARLMKSLYQAGLVTRNDSKKPFVYQITEEGRNHFSDT
ncbi:MAG: winged helix-turn-helix domain-containing protein [Thaumarchaeota archaeon]|nr:winged helix-turn-helix domain-containing protein [Nitrososphaerota archaeon]